MSLLTTRTNSISFIRHIEQARNRRGSGRRNDILWVRMKRRETHRDWEYFAYAHELGMATILWVTEKFTILKPRGRYARAPI